MLNKILRIGTRESPLAVWQAQQIQNHLHHSGIETELIFIKSEGDSDTVTPLYALGVQGIFTKTLDAALLNNRIDIAVHSMKDVPVQLAKGIKQAAVLKRGSYKDIFVYKEESDVEKLGYVHGAWLEINCDHSAASDYKFTIATSSIRRMAQWIHRYPHHTIENLRGNVNTRLKKVYSNHWSGAIFAAAGLERINLRPSNAVDLDWMLPAPAQGIIMVVCRESDETVYKECQLFNDAETALCAKIERDFLQTLMGGCSTPISALAEIRNEQLYFKGNILSVNGNEKMEIEKQAALNEAEETGNIAGKEILTKGANMMIEQIRNGIS